MSGKKNYPITIGEKVYQFRYAFDALTTIEDLAGKPFSAVIGDDRMKHWKITIFAGLNANHPEIKFEDVASLIDEAETLVQLKLDVNKALVGGLGITRPSDQGEEGDVKKKDPSTTTTGA